MIRPAVIAGLMLVIMETLSDFGAVDHFAIQTFTTGIFRNLVWDVRLTYCNAASFITFIIYHSIFGFGKIIKDECSL